MDDRAVGTGRASTAPSLRQRSPPGSPASNPYAAISAQSYALFLYTLPGTVTTWASSELNLPYATGADEATRWCCYRRRTCGYI